MDFQDTKTEFSDMKVELDYIEMMAEINSKQGGICEAKNIITKIQNKKLLRGLLRKDWILKEIPSSNLVENEFEIEKFYDKPLNTVLCKNPYITDTLITIPLKDKKIESVAKIRGMDFLYSSFYYPQICLEGCYIVHKNKKLEMMNKVLFQVEYLFCNRNLSIDMEMREKMSPSGWIPIDHVVKNQKLMELNVPLDDFIMFCEHSFHVEVSKDKKKLRSVHNPEFWYRVNFLPGEAEMNSKQYENSTDQKYDEYLFRKNLMIHGIEQRITRKYNKRLKALIENSDLEFSKYSIKYGPNYNHFDEGFQVVCIGPNLYTAVGSANDL